MRNRTLGESFRCAFQGLCYAVRTQRNFRLHLSAGVLVLLAAAWLRLPAVEAGLLLLTITAVVVAEVVNTALETLIDLVSPAIHPLAGTAKNLAAAAVVLAALAAAMIGVMILGPRALVRLTTGG